MKPIIIPGKPHLEIKLLEEADYPKLLDFCKSCETFGWINNSSFENLKIEKMKMPYGQFFIGYDHQADKIWNIAGIHHLPEISPNAYRCLFRGAQLPGYSVTGSFTKNIFLTGYQLLYFLDLQMRFIKECNPYAEFYMTTNNQDNEKDTAGKSKRMDLVMSKTLYLTGVLDRVLENFLLFNVKQTIWRVNEAEYYRQRIKTLSTMDNV